MMQIKPIYEFLVWDNCKNNCSFCFQRKCPNIFNYEQQRYALEYTLNTIRSSEFEPQSHVLVVGGELFDDYNRQEMAIYFFEEISKLMENGHIDLLYLNTNLIYSLQCLKNVIHILKFFEKNNLIQKLKFTTSYDIYGRFLIEKTKETFIDNLQKIKQEVPSVNIVVNSILTDQMCNSIMNHSFSPIVFAHTYNVEINLIPYIVLTDKLTPCREKVFQTIKQLYVEYPEFITSWITNLNLKQPRRLYKHINDNFIRCECQNSKCGHSENFKLYSNNKTCFVCDMLEFYNFIKK